MDLELTAAEERALEATPDRGVSLRETVGGTLTRFLPGSLIVILPFMLEPFLNPGAWGPLTWAGATTGSLTIGFALGLEAPRRWLYPDAAVDGRRSLIAGVLAPLALGIVDSPPTALSFSSCWDRTACGTDPDTRVPSAPAPDSTGSRACW